MDNLFLLILLLQHLDAVIFLGGGGSTENAENVFQEENIF